MVVQMNSLIVCVIGLAGLKLAAHCDCLAKRDHICMRRIFNTCNTLSLQTYAYDTL